MAHWGYERHLSDSLKKWGCMADNLIALCNQHFEFKGCYRLADDEPKNLRAKTPKKWLNEALNCSNATLALRFRWKLMLTRNVYFELLIAWDFIEIYIPSSIACVVVGVSDRTPQLFNHLIGVSRLIFDGNEANFSQDSDNHKFPTDFQRYYAAKVFQPIGITPVYVKAFR